MKNQHNKHLATMSIEDFNRQCERESFSRRTVHQKAMEKVIQNYCIDMSSCIGQGTFSRVYRAREMKSDQMVAVKIIELRKIKELGIEKIFWEELKIIKRLKHPNIVYCHEYFRTTNNCYTVYEYCEQGDLTKIIANAHLADRDDLVQINSIIKDVFQGLLYLNSNSIIHRDIKPANIFLSKGRAKIGDFGFATYCHAEFKDISIGSPAYMAPEGLLHHIYGLKTDVWSFGVLIFEMLHGKTPFCSCQSQQQLRHRVRIPLNWDQFKGFLPSSLKRLMIKCLKVNYEERQSFDLLYKDEYLTRLFFEGGKKDIFYSSSYTKQTSDSELNTPLRTQRTVGLHGQSSDLETKQQFINYQSHVLCRMESISESMQNLNPSSLVPTKILSNDLYQPLDSTLNTLQFFLFLKEDNYDQKDLQTWLLMSQIFNRLVSMSQSMQTAQLSSRLGCRAHRIARELAIRAEQAGYVQLCARASREASELSMRVGNVGVELGCAYDTVVMKEWLFAEIKECERRLDIQDIENSHHKHQSKQMAVFGNLLIIVHMMTVEGRPNPQKQRSWLERYKNCALESTEQFYIWLYELQLQLLQQQQVQSCKFIRPERDAI